MGQFSIRANKVGVITPLGNLGVEVFKVCVQAGDYQAYRALLE
ncbi:Unknown protein sequence [Pseudomonas syringae pv. maculicola]|nr:Unknown protein sequence [Pseudomonas syringae pv. maculicola]